MHPHMFREYDIRGLCGTSLPEDICQREDPDLTEEIVKRIGKAYNVYLRGKKNNCIVVGHDGRLTSRGFAHAVMDGVTSGGLDVIDIGRVPTPLMYFALFTMDVDGGLMITGSHNPKEYNGIKVAAGKNTIYGKEIQKLARIVIGGRYPLARKPVTITCMDIVPRYIRRVTQGVSLKRGLKVVVDAGNGVAGAVAVPLYERLGCEVIPLYCDVDGNFPHHHPDPTLLESLEKLIETVQETEADCGIAFDGDGDRLGVVTDKGEVLWGDKLLILFARSVLEQKPGATIIGEVKCSRTLYEDVAKHGGRPIMWKTGHSLIKAAMKQFHAQVAGEMSGHMFFKHRWYGFDDAIYSGARLLEYLSLSSRPLSEHVASIPDTYVTEEIRIDTDEDRKFGIVEQATAYFQEELGLEVNTIDGARVEFEDGWGLVRASNTSPKLVMRCEATTPERLAEIRELIEGKINELNV
ncbi:MAG TPA: phosphomannomutase/phosphoglucomutase [Candidatus Hydrogenedentes bacterium]|nr:phosphomannomutase/phosphoglucomutase [Candidatus Hydrogenedentota bacterium]